MAGGNPETFAEVLSERAPWWAPPRLNEAVTKRIHTEVVNWLVDIRDDPQHHARQALDSMLAQLAHDLQFDAETQARTERLKERVLDHPQVLASAVDSGTRCGGRCRPRSWTRRGPSASGCSRS